MGTSPAEQKQLAKAAAADNTTVSEFGERFFREIVAKDRADLTIPRRYFDKSIVPAIGTKPVREVTTEDVRADTIRRRLGWTPGTLNGSGLKPKGMHWRTFERLPGQHDAHVNAALVGMVARLRLLRP